MPKRSDIHSIMIIGAGPIGIGQACGRQNVLCDVKRFPRSWHRGD